MSSPIGILLEPSNVFVIAMLASFKAQLGFVPLDVNIPSQRLSYIIQECQIKILVTQKKFVDKVKMLNLVLKTIVIDEKAVTISNQSLTPLKLKNKKNTLAYIIYTSGTTGKPKGVPISHTNLLPLMLWQAKHFKLNKQTKTVQTLSLSFDFGIQEILTTILFGGTLYFPSNHIRNNPLEYFNFVNSNKITMIYSTPSFIGMVAELGRVPTLKFLLIGGQAFEHRLYKKLTQLVPNKCIIFNGYGPTEVSINATMFNVTDANLKKYQTAKTVPIGAVSANNKIYILDEDLMLVPTGVVGEIYIGGPGVSVGYINKPELNQEKFITHPFWQTGILYKTGDFARYLPNRIIEFIGRKDDQYKIRGFRVELAEIEKVLLENALIQQVIVLYIEKHEEKATLVCFYLTIDSKILPISDIKYQMEEKLPSYMLPSHFIRLDNFPLTENGKVDKKKLVAIYETVIRNRDFVKSECIELSETILAIWKKTLNHNIINIDDDFFKMGGHSLLIADVHTKLTQSLNIRPINFPIVKLFQYTTARELANYLSRQLDVDGKRAAPSNKRHIFRENRVMELRLRRQYKKI